MDEAFDTATAHADLPWLALLPVLLQADSLAHGLALAGACLGAGALLIPTLALARRAEPASLRWGLAAVAVAAAAGLVQQLALAADYAHVVGLDLGILLLAANLPLWRTAPSPRAWPRTLARALVAAAALVAYGALRTAAGDAAPARLQPAALLCLAAAALALRQAWRLRRDGAAPREGAA